jgi:hypothetical protein
MKPRHAYKRGIAFVLLALVHMACTGKTSSPVQPTPSERLKSFSISGVVRSGSVEGRGIPVVDPRVEILDGATAGSFVMTNGLGAYSLPTIPGMSNTFRLRASKDGYEPTTKMVGPVNSDSVVDLDLVGLSFSVVGTVTESAPTETTTVSGARLEIVAGAGAGTSTVSSQDGSFRFAETSGPIDVRVSRDGYVTDTFHVIRAGAETRFDARLVPMPRTITEEFDYFPRRQDPRSFLRPIHSDGLLVIDHISGMYQGYAEYQSAPIPDLVVEVWRGSDQVGQTRVIPTNPYSALTLP